MAEWVCSVAASGCLSAPYQYKNTHNSPYSNPENCTTDKEIQDYKKFILFSSKIFA
jgi:hypothetical protein